MGADSKYSFQMASGNFLEEVVVTSLGIKREAKALCYAVQNVTSETIAKSNATEALASYNDPRLDIYDGDGSSLYDDLYDSHEFFTIDQEVSLVSYSELQFVKAESLLATG